MGGGGGGGGVNKDLIICSHGKIVALKALPLEVPYSFRGLPLITPFVRSVRI